MRGCGGADIISREWSSLFFSIFMLLIAFVMFLCFFFVFSYG